MSETTVTTKTVQGAVVAVQGILSQLEDARLALDEQIGQLQGTLQPMLKPVAENEPEQGDKDPPEPTELNERLRILRDQLDSIRETVVSIRYRLVIPT